MVSYAKPPKIPQIAFHIQGELQKSLPIRLEDFNGLILPEKSSHVPGHSEQYMQNAVFSFVIILEKGDVDKDVRQLMSGFQGQGMNYTSVPEPPIAS